MGTDNKLGKQFEELANPNEEGFSQKIDVTSLDGENEILNVTNGSSYTRKGSYLDEKYYIKKYYEKYTLDTSIEDHKKGIGKGKLQSIELIGYKDEKSI